MAANVTVPMIVVGGLATAVMQTVHAGAKRTYAEALKLAGEENTSVQTAVTRHAILWDRGFRVRPGSVYRTAHEMNAFLDDNRRLRTLAEIAVKLATRSLLPSSIIGLCHWLFSDIDPDDAAWFLARLADGDGLSADDPIAALRNRIVKVHIRGVRVNETDALALITNAWNAHRAGETRSKLQLPRGELTTEKFPEPEEVHCLGSVRPFGRVSPTVPASALMPIG